jgi:hypothetical protein
VQYQPNEQLQSSGYARTHLDVHLLAAIFAHNLNRELHMSASEPTRATTDQREPCWKFVRLDTLRQGIIQRASRLVRPQGRLTLKLSANQAVQTEMLHYLAAAA